MYLVWNKKSKRFHLRKQIKDGDVVITESNRMGDLYDTLLWIKRDINRAIEELLDNWMRR